MPVKEKNPCPGHYDVIVHDDECWENTKEACKTAGVVFRFSIVHATLPVCIITSTRRFFPFIIYDTHNIHFIEYVNA